MNRRRPGPVDVQRPRLFVVRPDVTGAMRASPGYNVALFVRLADVRVFWKVGEFDAGSDHNTGIFSPR